MISRFMVRCFLAVGLGAGALVYAEPAAKSPVTPNGIIRLFQSEGRVLVMMRIGDGELVPMVFDSGSDGHSFDRMLVARNRLKRSGETIEIDGTTGKRRTLPTYALPDARLGGLKVGTIEGVALDYDRDDAMGIISPDMFAGSLVYLELDRGRARVVTRDASATPATPATPYNGALPGVSVQMPDGSVHPADLDTGYNAPISLPVAMMGTVPLMAPPKVVGRFKSINTEGDVYGGQVRGTLRVGPVVLENPHVTFLGTTINVGLPIIRRVTLVLDPAGKRDWLLPPAEAKPPVG